MKLLCVLALCLVGAYAQSSIPSLGQSASGSSLNNAFKTTTQQLSGNTAGGLSSRAFSSPLSTGAGGASFANTGFASTSAFPSVGQQFTGATMSSPSAYPTTSGVASLSGFSSPTASYVTQGMGNMASPGLNYAATSSMPFTSTGMNYANSAYAAPTTYSPFGMSASFPMGNVESRVLGVFGGGQQMSMFPGMGQSMSMNPMSMMGTGQTMYANNPSPYTGGNMCFNQLASAASPSPVNWSANMMMPSTNYATQLG